LLNIIAVLLVSLMSLSVAGSAAAKPYATAWVEGHNSRTRLLVGGAPAPDGRIARYIGLEVALQPGWKTYWRQPGSAGGIPPQVSWQGSVNLAKATLSFPAPKRMVDPTGDTIGYKDNVVFPIAIEAQTPGQPVVVNMKAYFGVCREICIPAQAAFKVTLGPENFRLTPPELARALEHVPVTPAAGDAGRPRLTAVRKEAAGAGGNALVFDAAFPGGTAGADLFAETGDLTGLAMSKEIARPAPDTVRYKIVVADAGLWRELADKGLVVTLVSKAGASEVRISRP
jgi:DsbC/DsbD-like thiol-disulfide interchange protein